MGISSVLFKIGTTDLTQYCDPEQHKVNRFDVYETWTDGNYIDHRAIARTRITGEIFLKFRSESDFTTVKSLLTSQRNADGYYAISVYCSNTGSLESINAFLDYEGEDQWDVTAPLHWHGMTIEITQR